MYNTFKIYIMLFKIFFKGNIIFYFKIKIILWTFLIINYTIYKIYFPFLIYEKKYYIGYLKKGNLNKKGKII